MCVQMILVCLFVTWSRVSAEKNYTVLTLTAQDSICVEKSSCATWGNSTHAEKFASSWNCYCDELCQVYGDCCENYATYFQPNPKLSALPEGSFSCENIRGMLGEDMSIHMVNRCPSDWPASDQVAQQCQETRTSDLLSQWPVSDSRGVTFKNIFCSLCHGRRPSDVSYWNADYKCENVTQDIRTLIKNGSLDEYCYRDGWMAPKNIKVRECEPYIKTCKPDYTNTTVISDCINGFTSKVYTTRMYGTYITTYKNKFCAECNGVSGACIVHRMFFKSAQAPNDAGLYPMSLLLDLNSGGGGFEFESKVGRFQSRTNKVAMDFKQCPERHVYDPFVAVCRRIGCAAGYTLVQDECVSDNANLGKNSSCLSHVLNETEYTILPTGELYINSSGELLDTSDYETNPDGSVLVCTNWTRNYTASDQPFMEFKFDDTQTILSVIGQIISLVALAIHFMVYLLLPSLRNLAGKNLMCLVASLFVAQFFFLFGIGRSSIYELCFAIAVVIHFAFLASFFWMNVISVDIFRTFSKRTKAVTSDQHSRLFKRYSIFAWTGPSVIVLLTIVLDVTAGDVPLRPGYGEGVCWITSRWALMLLFGLPVLAIVVINTVLFSLTIKNLCQLAQDTKAVSKSSDRQRLLLYIKLSTIMGLTWLFGFLATWTEVPPLWYVFIVLNSLQGAFICLAFVCNAKTLRMLKEKFRRDREQAPSDGTRSTLLSNSQASNGNNKQRTSGEISKV